MAETTIQITSNDNLLLRYSAWTGRLIVYHNGHEIGKFGMLGGVQTFKIGEKLVEVESRLTAWLTNRTTVRVDGVIVGQYSWL